MSILGSITHVIDAQKASAVSMEEPYAQSKKRIAEIEADRLWATLLHRPLDPKNNELLAKLAQLPSGTDKAEAFKGYVHAIQNRQNNPSSLVEYVKELIRLPPLPRKVIHGRDSDIHEKMEVALHGENPDKTFDAIIQWAHYMGRQGNGDSDQYALIREKISDYVLQPYFDYVEATVKRMELLNGNLKALVHDYEKSGRNPSTLQKLVSDHINSNMIDAFESSDFFKRTSGFVRKHQRIAARRKHATSQVVQDQNRHPVIEEGSDNYEELKEAILASLETNAMRQLVDSLFMMFETNPTLNREELNIALTRELQKYYVNAVKHIDDKTRAFIFDQLHPSKRNVLEKVYKMMSTEIPPSRDEINSLAFKTVLDEKRTENVFPGDSNAILSVQNFKFELLVKKWVSSESPILRPPSRKSTKYEHIRKFMAKWPAKAAKMGISQDDINATMAHFRRVLKKRWPRLTYFSSMNEPHSILLWCLFNSYDPKAIPLLHWLVTFPNDEVKDETLRKTLEELLNKRLARFPIGAFIV